LNELYYPYWKINRKRNMQVNILFFGQLTDITGSQLVLQEIRDTDALKAELNKRYPALVNSKFIITVDKKNIVENTILNDNSTVALLPPFSGG
jgi:sulfur-carrier protein